MRDSRDWFFGGSINMEAKVKRPDLSVDLVITEPKFSHPCYIGPYGTGVSLTDPVSEPPKSSNYIGPYGAGVDQNDR